MIEERCIVDLPARLIGVKAYDYDPLDQAPQQDIESIVPHRGNRKKNMAQDGMKLRCYQHRWRVESFFAWSLIVGGATLDISDISIKYNVESCKA